MRISSLKCGPTPSKLKHKPTLPSPAHMLPFPFPLAQNLLFLTGPVLLTSFARLPVSLANECLDCRRTKVSHENTKNQVPKGAIVRAWLSHHPKQAPIGRSRATASGSGNFEKLPHSHWPRQLHDSHASKFGNMDIQTASSPRLWGAGGGRWLPGGLSN
ncbi:hypothetical protein GGI42DRAFT_274377 [Trichoderma sp. SZMC 28013]